MMTLPDYLGEADLRALALDPAAVERLLADSPLRGHGSRRVIEAEHLDDLLGMLDREDDR